MEIDLCLEHFPIDWIAWIALQKIFYFSHLLFISPEVELFDYLPLLLSENLISYLSAKLQYLIFCLCSSNNAMKIAKSKIAPQKYIIGKK